MYQLQEVNEVRVAQLHLWRQAPIASSNWAVTGRTFITCRTRRKDHCNKLWYPTSSFTPLPWAFWCRQFDQLLCRRIYVLSVDVRVNWDRVACCFFPVCSLCWNFDLGLFEAVVRSHWGSRLGSNILSWTHRFARSPTVVRLSKKW